MSPHSVAEWKAPPERITFELDGILSLAAASLRPPHVVLGALGAFAIAYNALMQ